MQKNAFYEKENYRINDEEMKELLSYARRVKKLSISALQKRFGYGYRKANYIHGLLEGKE